MAGWALLAIGALVSCSDAAPEEFPSDVPYKLGGQTGSLIPDCGVAPLSQTGLAVPSGDVLAVLYTRGCPEGVTPEVAVTGPDARPVASTLEPLEGSEVYLVRVDQSLATGEHQLALPGSSSSTLIVGDAASRLPTQLDGLSPIDESTDCEFVRFEWELTEEALAHAALMRLWVRVDAGREQLWVDYGALEIEVVAAGSRGLLRLPRCGETSCLYAGVHELEVRAELAGEELQPEPLQTSFEVQCADALRATNPAMYETEPAFVCSAVGTAPTTRSSFTGLYWILGLAMFFRRRLARTPTR
jgi:hypothetical protein